MAWMDVHGDCEPRTLAPCVAALMNCARNAERRSVQHARHPSGGLPVHRSMTVTTRGGWNDGGSGWSVERGTRKWVDNDRQWRDWNRESWANREGQWAQHNRCWKGWAPQATVEARYGKSQVANGGNRAAQRGYERCGKDTWDWDDYIITKGWTVRVELNGRELGDSDLESLVRHLEGVMLRFIEQTDGKYALSIDLSCNLYISDDGVQDHLAPFLHRWPVCHRLKLFKTSIGDGALAALSSWAASGHAHELHLSDLGGHVTGEAVFAFLKEVHERGQYPYWNSVGMPCALWVRLEHNGVPSPDKLVSRAHAEGISLSVLHKLDLGYVRPGMPSCQSTETDVPAMNLVLFHKQELRVSRQWMSAMQQLQPVSQELQQLVGAASSGSASCAAEVSAMGAAREGKPYTPASLQKFLGPSQRYHLQNNYHNNNAQTQATLKGGRTPMPDKEEGEIEGRLSRAVDVVLACPTGVDSEVFRRWHRHLQRAKDPEGEARRIRGMTAKLCNAGYLDRNSPELQDADALASSPSKTPFDDTSCAASAVTASEAPDSLGSASLTAKPEDESSIDDVLVLEGVASSMA